MSDLPSLAPWGARLIAMAEVEDLLAQLIANHERVEPMTAKWNSGLAERYALEAKRWREIRWSLDASDTVWLLTEPPHHPDFIQGSAYLVVIRHGKLLGKHRLFDARRRRCNNPLETKRGAS